jgi:hypothetical protein
MVARSWNAHAISLIHLQINDMIAQMRRYVGVLVIGAKMLRYWRNHSTLL